MGTALGDFLIRVSKGASVDLPAKALNAEIWPGGKDVRSTLTVRTPARGVSLACTGDVRFLADARRGGLGLARVPKENSVEGKSSEGDAPLRLWLQGADSGPRDQRGRFVYACWDAEARTLVAFTDPFRTYSLFYVTTPDGILCATDLRLILASLPSRPEADIVSLYHYLNFAYIPSPHSAVAGVRKLEPGSRLDWRAGNLTVQRLDDTRYPEDLSGPDHGRARELRDRIVQTVGDYYPEPSVSWGAFLSGGTDSSSIAGILSRADPLRPVDTFSIGFGEGAYDELAFSRIAVRHFGLKPHERVVNEADSVAVIPQLVRGFDEPFGNSSAIPTFYCADLARREGKVLLIAGDGGDEIFGGNERYAKDQIFRWFHHSPALVRGAGRLLARSLGPIDTHLSNRIRNMIHRGLLPNPDRFYNDDSFASDHFDDLLTTEFRARVDRDDSLRLQREIFARADTTQELHRLMYLDLQLTIAESDVVKVVRSARIAGIDVAFPYLDRALVAYSGRLPPRFKVKGLTKRYLFRQAMADILPAEIIKKKKQGFGLPMAVWLRQGGAMRDMVQDVLGSQRARARGYFQPAFVQQLLDRHEQGTWDNSSEIFRLLMLELWHREYLDGHV